MLDEPAIHKGEPVPLGGGAYKKARDEARMADAHHRITGFLAEFSARSAAAGVSADVLEDIGDPADRILHEAHRCDVVILARETHFHFETQERPDETLAQILRGCPRPVVVVPRTLPESHGVVVAYGGGREAARTLQTFQSLGLAAGEDIEVVTIHRDGAVAEATAHLAGAFLTAHGARHRLHPVASGVAPAKVLLEHLTFRRPRLLVMGAHAHHPLRDLFAASVTRAVLAACPVPAFIGGAALENFALVVLVGAITGPLSTVYVAAALDVDWTTWITRRRATRGGAPVRRKRAVAQPEGGGAVVRR